MKKFNPETLLKEISNLSNAPQRHHLYAQPVIHKYQISPKVEYVKFWSRKRPLGFKPFECFLIKSGQQYVGLVIMVLNSLHCHLLPQFRSSGQLFPALRSAILPFLFLHQGWEQVQISLREDDSTQTQLSISRKLLLLLGFTETKKAEFVLEIDNCDFSAIQLDFQHPGMTLQQFEATKLELDAMARRLLQLDAQLESAYGKPLTLNPKDFLQTLALDLREHQNKLVKRAVAFHKNEAEVIEREFME